MTWPPWTGTEAIQLLPIDKKPLGTRRTAPFTGLTYTEDETRRGETICLHSRKGDNGYTGKTGLGGRSPD